MTFTPSVEMYHQAVVRPQGLLVRLVAMPLHKEGVIIILSKCENGCNKSWQDRF